MKLTKLSMRLPSLIGLCLLSAAVFAQVHQPPLPLPTPATPPITGSWNPIPGVTPGVPPDSPEGKWIVEFVMSNGSYSREGGYADKDSCTAAIPAVLAKQGGYNGHCIQYIRGHLIGSQDPVWAGRNSNPNAPKQP